MTNMKHYRLTSALPAIAAAFALSSTPVLAQEVQPVPADPAPAVQPAPAPTTDSAPAATPDSSAAAQPDSSARRYGHVDDEDQQARDQADCP
jgi:hypothetical protein